MALIDERKKQMYEEDLNSLVEKFKGFDVYLLIDKEKHSEITKVLGKDNEIFKQFKNVQISEGDMSKYIADSVFGRVYHENDKKTSNNQAWIMFGQNSKLKNVVAIEDESNTVVKSTVRESNTAVLIQVTKFPVQTFNILIQGDIDISDTEQPFANKFGPVVFKNAVT